MLFLLWLKYSSPLSQTHKLRLGLSIFVYTVRLETFLDFSKVYWFSSTIHSLNIFSVSPFRQLLYSLILIKLRNLFVLSLDFQCMAYLADSQVRAVKKVIQNLGKKLLCAFSKSY